MSNENNEKFTSKFVFDVNYLSKMVALTVLFNEHNTYMAYHIDHSIYNVFKNRYNLNIMFDITKSSFCNTFLDIDTIKTDGVDNVNKFNSIYTQFKDIIYYDGIKSVVMDKIVKNGILENKIDIHLLRLYKFKDSFLYCICNRQYIDKKYYKIITRSSAFCIYSKECYKYLQSLYKKYKSCGVKKQTAEDAIESLFTSNNGSLTPQQLQHGFIL